MRKKTKKLTKEQQLKQRVSDLQSCLLLKNKELEKFESLVSIIESSAVVLGLKNNKRKSGFYHIESDSMDTTGLLLEIVKQAVSGINRAELADKGYREIHRLEHIIRVIAKDKTLERPKDIVTRTDMFDRNIG